MLSEKILVTGAGGQIGTVLCNALREIYGEDNVIGSDIKSPKIDRGKFVILDILNTQRFCEIIDDHKITQIYHLAAILSASGEWMPLKTWNVNLNSLLDIFEIAREKQIRKIFFPSTIAVFGKTTPKKRTPQFTSLEPTTVYGMSKLTGELWAQYYFQKYNLDIRSVRFPGIVSHQSMPGGGTTDYAVEIFHKAIQDKSYECFLKKDTYLPMVYMEDAIQGTLKLMETPADQLSVRTSYNLAAMSFSPEELAAEIKKHMPEFTIRYKPDFRQAIAESWSQSIDDQVARNDWGWNPKFDLQKMTKDMLFHLNKSKKLNHV